MGTKKQEVFLDTSLQNYLTNRGWNLHQMLGSVRGKSDRNLMKIHFSVDLQLAKTLAKNGSGKEVGLQRQFLHDQAEIYNDVGSKIFDG